MVRFILCVSGGVIAGNLAFDATGSFLACGAASFVVSFLLTILTEK